MVTLKIKPYSNFEVEILQKMLADNIVHLQASHCHTVCECCPVHHVCIDLQSAELFARDILAVRKGENHG